MTAGKGEPQKSIYYYTNYESPLGKITLAGSEESVVGLWIKAQKYFGDTVDGELIRRDSLPVLQQGAKWLDAYFTGKRPQAEELPLAPIGDAFRQHVWKILTEIPYGETMTYGEIAVRAAERMGRETASARAAGGAVAHNPISIIIPCHRAVGKNGSLTGYSGGIDKKIWLLEHEGADISKFFVPKKGTAL